MPWTTKYINDTLCTTTNINSDTSPSNNNSNKALSALVHFIEWNLRGISQVYFCNNPVTGALILLGLFLQSYKIAFYGVIGVSCGTLAALVFKYDRSAIASGLLGYNPFLVGLAISTFHQEGDDRFEMILGIILTCILCTVLFNVMGRMFKKWESPVFTFPFNISTMIYLLFASKLNNNDRHLTIDSWMVPDNMLNPLQISIATMRGFGQVFLANNLVSCLLIMLGITICSRILLFSALLGSVAGSILAMLLSGSIHSNIVQGLWSYNASLTLAAIFLFYVPSFRGCMMGLLAAVLSVLVHYVLSFGLLSPLGLPVMTFPFCISSLAFVWIQYLVRFSSMEDEGREKKGYLYMSPVPLLSIHTPEEHIRRQQVLQDAFYLIFKVIHSNDTNHPARKQILPSAKILAVVEEIRENICGNGSGSTSSNNTMQGANFDQNVKRLFQDIDTNNSGHITGNLFTNYLRQEQHLDDNIHFNLANKAFNLFSVGVHGSHIMDLKNFMVLARVSHLLNDLKDVLMEFSEIILLGHDDQELLCMDALNDALVNLTGDQHSKLTQIEYDYLCFNSYNFEDAGGSSQGFMDGVQMTNFILASFLTCN
mmetsp:Transcript_833/g.1439  ORF Transcript_833/g.1439 Transcript_833/m.1439 type:complete len:596 (+) Transcript_833:1-1788(+)